MNSKLTYEEFLEGLHSFDTNETAVGIDGVSYQLLTHLPSTWNKLLFSLFQKCWKGGILPSVWKKTIIVPILKQGKSRVNIDSYRPVALTSQVGKVLEKIVQKRLLYFCDKNSIRITFVSISCLCNRN